MFVCICTGRVYDASSSSMFQDSYKAFAGQDATIALAIMSLVFRQSVLFTLFIKRVSHANVLCPAIPTDELHSSVNNFYASLESAPFSIF